MSFGSGTADILRHCGWPILTAVVTNYRGVMAVPRASCRTALRTFPGPLTIPSSPLLVRDSEPSPRSGVSSVKPQKEET
jgi:hypothetical protein